MNNFLKSTIFSIIIIVFFVNCSETKEQVEKPQETKLNLDSFGFNVDSVDVLSRNIKKNETLADLLLEAKINYILVDKVYKTAKPTFDFKKIKPGRILSIYTSKDSLHSFVGLAYEIDKFSYLKIINTDSLDVQVINREIIKKERSFKGTITSSLYETLSDSNSSIVLAGELADVFAWQIDFYTIQKGDRFSVLYDELYVDNKPVGVGDIITAKFIHKNNSYYAFKFNQENKIEYFDEDGKSLQKQFLKAPLKYKRISSNYSRRRLHPILRVYRPHLGIDYAAAIGTPVQAVGDGIVIKVGRNGAAGRMVKIRHNSTYTSAYLHLSGYAKGIRRNVRVKQGQIIGYVGSSGRSTGPHLDFRFWKRGSLVNYLTQKFPSSKSVADSNMQRFITIRDSLKSILDTLD